MSEHEEWQGQRPAAEGTSEHGGSRDGFTPSYHRENNQSERPSYNRGDRPQRPRFNRPTYNADNAQGGYQPRPYNREGGYQPRPYNNNREGGYQPRPYNREGGYQPHQYNNNREGGYQPRPYNREGGYQPRPYNREGGYQSRPYNREGGYQPRQYNREGGYQPRPYNTYNREGGYQPRQGGYQSRGGYANNGGAYQQRNGFSPRSGGYNANTKYSTKKRIEYKERLEDPNAPLRLNKFLANAGVCSRREADQFIKAGVVTVNGEVVTELGTKVMRTDEVHFHNQLVSIEKKVYVLLNKPKDYVTTADDPQQRKTVMDLVRNCCRERIYPVGRLDRNTTGVLLLTNDGDLASKLTHPKFLKKKIYHVFLDKNLTAADLKQIAEGVTLEDGEIKADAISYASDEDHKQVGIEIHSGKNRIVRRIFESLGYKVYKLDRVMFAGLTKKGVKRGDWRFLTDREVTMLYMGSYE